MLDICHKCLEILTILYFKYGLHKNKQIQFVEVKYRHNASTFNTSHTLIRVKIKFKQHQ